MTEKVKIAVVGSGPGGLSAAARAAEQNVPHVLLEAEAQVSNTIYRYQKGKHVMAEPGILPLRTPVGFTAGKREEVLGKWEQDIARHKVNVRYRSAVTRITGQKGAFELQTAAGETWLAEHVVLCIGVQGNFRKLGVPGEDLEMVQYTLDDAGAYQGETIVVVGAGDAAIENAIALAEGNRVILINRSAEFARAKQGNLDLVLAAVRDGKLDCRYETTAVRVEAKPHQGRRGRFVALTPQGEQVIACDRVIGRLGAIPPRKLVEGFGVTFPSKDADAVPRLSVTYESNVPGMYIIGALAGYPLIKQCLNQGHDVVEYILGREPKPVDEPLLKQKFAKFPHDGGVSRALALVQQQVPLFADMSRLQLREFMLESELHAPALGEIIFRKGDYTNSFFSILEGEVLVEITDEAGVKLDRRLERGEFFGELGLISGRRRSSTVRAGRGCVLIESPRRSMLRLMGNVESVRRKIDQTFLRRAVLAYVAPSVSRAELDEIVANAKVKTFPAGATLFQEGDEPDGLHLIRRGSVTVSRQIGGREVVLSYVAAGNYVGEMALLSDARRSASVRAAVTTETIVLPPQQLKQVLERNTDLRGGMEARVLERVAQNVRREDEPNASNLTTFLVSQGLGEATDVLLIDESLCIRCDNCEKACADTHGGTSRLDRQAGPTYAHVHVPTSCRHCENPHCMKDCPPDAIHRNPNGEVFIQDTCIGCGNCQRNCPYGVIQLAPVDPKGSSLWTWLLTGLSAEPGRQLVKKKKDQQKVAVKCDMCKELSGGPACVRACPTGAAIRVSPERFLDYTNR